MEPTMEPLRLKPRKPVEDEVEDWDDDDFMIDTDEDLTFRNNSSTNLQLHRRDSHSSFRSDRESLSANEERHVHLPGDDEKSTLDAIAAATHVGIPIPTNVPPSALMGGTIKRLGGRKIKKIFQEDWGDDLELPAAGQALRLKTQDGTRFPEILRQVSGSVNPSPAKKSIPSVPKSPPLQPIQPKALGPPINLERFRDTEEDEDLFGDGSATIKAPRILPRGRPMSLITPLSPSPPSPGKKADDSDFEHDLELPSDGKLQLSSRRDIPKTPSLHMNEDFEWGEGSLGTRFGGTRRDVFSTRSSSVSALSPSLASSFTAESEDDTFEGLVLPNGPLDFSELLNRQKQSRSTERNESDRRPQLKQIGPPRRQNSGSQDSERRSRPRQSQSPRPQHQIKWPRPAQSQSPVGRLPEKLARPTRSPERRGIARLPFFMQSRSPDSRDQQSQDRSTQSQSPVGRDRDIQLRSPQSRISGAVRRSLGEGDLDNRPYPILSRFPAERVLENQARLAQSRSPVRRDAESRPRSAPTQSPGGRSLLKYIPSPSRSPPHSPIYSSSRVSPRSPASPPPRATPTASPRATPPTAKKTTQLPQDEDDLFSGLDFGDGNVFRPGKATLHRNIKVREARPSSPVRPKTAVSITFTNKPVTSTPSRLPRPTANHERSHTQSSLEPVSESGGPIPQKPPRRPQSRLGGHSAQSSLSSIKPSPPFSVQSSIPSASRRRDLGSKVSMGALRNEPTTTNAQLLRLKRSLPAMRHNQPSAKSAVSRFDRPPSRTDSRGESQRSQPSFRPKTPVDQVRPVNEVRATQVRKGQAPFLPAGASQSQSHHVSTKQPRVFRRHDSDQGPEARPSSRAFSRAGMRSPSPRRLGHEKSSSEPMWQQINKPRRLRHFGDGHELDAFDDLPTSAHTESRYTKQPVAVGNKNGIRNKLYQNILPDRTPSPAPPQPQPKTDNLPRFARDTAASRIAREVSLAQRSPLSGPLGPVNAQRMNPLPRSNLNPLHNPVRSKKPRKPKQLKPHLISNLNSGKESKVVNGMTYNPTTYRWEGNENALKAFSTSTSSPSHPPFRVRERETSTPKPLLIANINASKGAKRVGDMVFDPQNMCWLKVDTSTPSTLRSDDPMEGFNILEDEDDPFKDIPDLEDRDKDSAEGGHGRASDIREDWLVGEEFDVGPEFIRRQHEEEARWRRKCEKWTKPGTRNQENWRWTLRDMIMGG